MDAEIQFFMSEKDEEDFFDFASKHVDNIERNDSTLYLLIDDCKLTFSASILERDILYKGLLEIRLNNVDASCKGIERAKSTFRKLRNWIKKKYWSRLAYFNKNKKDKLTPTRVHWLGPDAKKWKDSDPENHVLKLSTTSWMIFEIGF